jgi:pimeloyl-ACP methyl ester carboxylesterase
LLKQSSSSGNDSSLTSQTSASNKLYKEIYGTGDPILCLHGLGASLYTWRNFIAPFSQKNKLILVDFKGCGKSPKPRDKHYSIEEHTNDIYKIIIEEDLKNLTLIGNSLGGAIAMLLAIRLSEENPTRLSRLILIDSAGDQRFLPIHFKLVRSILGAPILNLSPGKLVVRQVLRMCYYDKKKVSVEDVNAYALARTSPGARYALLQTVRQCIPPNADELLGKVKNLTVPTLILWGREDGIIPLKVGELLHEAIPNSVLEVIERCGHVPQEEKPAETIERISRFLWAGI